MSDLKVACRIVPELDPGFVPAALWNREFCRLAANGTTNRMNETAG